MLTRLPLIILLITSSLFASELVDITKLSPQLQKSIKAELNPTMPVSKVPARKLPKTQDWQSIRVGMPVEEVIRILGRPYQVMMNGEIYKYGSVDDLGYDGGFYIRFEDDRVFQITNPFGDRLSPDDKPMVPEIVYPKDNIIYKHEPRIVDFRWIPVHQAKSYKVELEIHNGTNWIPLDTLRIKDQHFDYLFYKAAKLRWRVEAMGKRVGSGWTDWAYFDFYRPAEPLIEYESVTEPAPQE